MTEPAITPRPAATLILARDTPAGLEVFLLQRTHRAVFMPGVFVFPGGAVDAADAHAAIGACCSGHDDVSASRLLGVEHGGLGYLVAAIRECYEEAGLLLASEATGGFVDLDAPERAQAFADYRRQLVSGGLTLAELCRQHDLRLELDRLAFFSHWITPAGPPRRYDTRFFTAVAPPGQTASHDGTETIAHAWIGPQEALDRNRCGEFPLASPTIRTLKALTAFADTAALMEYAQTPRNVTPAKPRFGSGTHGQRVFLQGDPVYGELAKLDPDNRGSASYEIVPGMVTELSERVRRIAAPNPSAMTGPGTNTYLVGNEEVAVIDPGPANEEHVERILAAADGRIRWILVTHTHRDHSPAAARLKAACGAPLLGLPAPPHPGQDQGFQPDRMLSHGERLDIDGATLRVIHTPGHASNHLCYLLEEEKLLFSGDHLMQGSTVVINPPDGDMAAYLASLNALQEEPIEHIAPGHGFLMEAPHQVIDRVISHRMVRENKVLKALRELGGAASEQALLPLVYQDVPERMHPIASRSLLAHLLKLQGESVVVLEKGRWLLAEKEIGRSCRS
jgi:glyoxylase-like metal-dependent hydrolase (beta-lactamase superfamily II)/8-oxo-dGTP pyrophosphatase MutT (NUDIX family)